MRGSPLGQANSANPLPSPPPPSPMPKVGSVQLPVPSNSSGARQHRQCGHGFLSSSWGQQLLLSCGPQGMPFPGSSSQGETQEQMVQIRNTSVRDCFKTRLLQASRTKDVERSAQHHSVDEPCPPTFLPGGSQHIHFTLRARSCRWEPRVEGHEGKRWRQEDSNSHAAVISPKPGMWPRAQAALNGRGDGYIQRRHRQGWQPSASSLN